MYTNQKGGGLIFLGNRYSTGMFTTVMEAYLVEVHT